MTVQSVYSPLHGRNLKFGRKRPIARGPRLQLRDYLKYALPDPPSSADYSAKAAAALAKVYLNDDYGDCVIAGGYHITGVETGNAFASNVAPTMLGPDGRPRHQGPFIATDAQIIADYSAIGGFDPNNPDGTDQGCNVVDALNYWTQHGFANGTKLLGWAAVNAEDPKEVKAALYLFENLMFGIELPDAWINPFPSAPGFTWGDAGPPNPNQGHCIVGVGYGAQGIDIATWGMLGGLTYEAIAKYCVSSVGGELYVMLSPDQITKGATKAPNGVDWDTLLADFKSLNTHRSF